MALYQAQHQVLTPFYAGFNPQVGSLSDTARTLWYLGYPEQARKPIPEALHLAQELGHPHSLVRALGFAVMVHIECGDGYVAQECADAMVALSSEHGFPFYLAWGTTLRGAALIAQEQWEEGVVQIRQGLEAYAGEISRTHLLTWLAVGHGGAGQVEDGLAAVAEALRLVDKNDERYYEAELYRVKGQLTLQKFQVSGFKFQVEKGPASSVQSLASEAEECFLKAIEVAQKQQAKSLELRATMSLARLWQQQGKKAEARQLLAEIYGWFTEGFDTKDLQEAKALLQELEGD